jgi:hypothetical protein
LKWITPEEEEGEGEEEGTYSSFLPARLAQRSRRGH